MRREILFRIRISYGYDLLLIDLLNIETSAAGSTVVAQSPRGGWLGAVVGEVAGGRSGGGA